MGPLNLFVFVYFFKKLNQELTVQYFQHGPILKLLILQLYQNNTTWKVHQWYETSKCVLILGIVLNAVSATTLYLANTNLCLSFLST